MAKKLEFYEDAHERFEAGMRKLLAPKPSKHPKELTKTQPETLDKNLNRS